MGTSKSLECRLTGRHSTGKCPWYLVVSHVFDGVQVAVAPVPRLIKFADDSMPLSVNSAELQQFFDVTSMIDECVLVVHCSCPKNSVVRFSNVTGN